MRRVLPLLLATVLTTACIEWLPLEDPKSYVTTSHPEQLRVTLTDGEHEIVLSPTVSDSDIVGSVDNGAGMTHVQIPLAEVKLVELPTTRAPSTDEALWVVAGLAAVFAAIKLL